MKKSFYLLLIGIILLHNLPVESKLSSHSWEYDYFSQVIKDPLDFEEGDQENFDTVFWNPTDTYISNGILIWNTSGDTNDDGYQMINLAIDPTFYTIIRFEAKSRVCTGGDRVVLNGSNFAGFTMGCNYQTFEIDISSYGGIVGSFGIVINDDNSNNTMYLKYIELLAIINVNEEFQERTNPYFWDSKDYIYIRGLDVNTRYGILIGSNQATSEQQWINFTADETRAKIWFRQSSAEYTTDLVKISQLFIDLYNMTSIYGENTTYLHRIALDIIYKDEQVDFGSITENIILLILYYMFLLALGGFTYAIVTSYKKYRYR